MGAGPGGLFAALVLARCGLRPILLERGRDTTARQRDVETFWRTGVLDPESNVQFGEGGAGAFSDGKLNTGTKDLRHRWILEELVRCGAPESILTDAKPHVGTDMLHIALQNLRQELLSLGAQVRFGHRLEGLESRDGVLTGLHVRAGEGTYRLPVRAVVLAPGHSARDTFQMLYEAGVPMEAKPFAVGDYVDTPCGAGTVKELTLTYTYLDTPDGLRIAAPNSSLSAGKITNYTTLGTRRIQHSVSASYDAPVQTVRQALLDAYDGAMAARQITVYAAPSDSAASLRTLRQGKVARLNDVTEDGSWYQITFSGTTGYVRADGCQAVQYSDYAGTSAVKSAREDLVDYAKSFLGTRYVWGGASPSGFDCSGFTMYVYAHFGYRMSHGASDQLYAFTRVSTAERLAGDLVFFSYGGGDISQVGIYLGGGAFIHATSNGGVKISYFDGYYSSTYVGAVRILAD